VPVLDRGRGAHAQGLVLWNDILGLTLMKLDIIILYYNGKKK